MTWSKPCVVHASPDEPEQRSSNSQHKTGYTMVSAHICTYSRGASFMHAVTSQPPLVYLNADLPVDIALS